MRTIHGVIGFFALTLASWPGGPSAQAHITAHGALIDEQSNSEHASVLAPPEDVTTQTFDMVMVNTQERATLRLVGTPPHLDADSLAKMRHLLRAFPADKEGPLDPALADTLASIAMQTHETIEIVSGYRLPKNRWDHNYHVRGQSADIRVRGVPVWKLRALVKKLGVNGIGYYPTSGFVHVDTRDVPYQWTDWSGPSKEK
jgi:uncharacterized protein YcbK (DUF882 family)